MKKDIYIWIIVIGIAVFLFINRKKVKIVAQKLTRGYRNNNPGNIVLTWKHGNKYFWKGEIEGKDKRFKKFKSIDWGYRAMFITLNSYINKGVDTIAEIIHRWAPPHENNTFSYATHVSERSGIPLNRKVSFDNPEDIKEIVKQISRIENGIASNEDDIDKGYELFSS